MSVFAHQCTNIGFNDVKLNHIGNNIQVLNFCTCCWVTVRVRDTNFLSVEDQTAL